MANRKNAILQLKKDEKRKIRNSAERASLKTARKKFEKVLDGKDKETAQNALKDLSSTIDGTIKKGVIPKGRGARLKSKYTLKVNALS